MSRLAGRFAEMISVAPKRNGYCSPGGSTTVIFWLMVCVNIADDGNG
jgi:hypothetical protein